MTPNTLNVWLHGDHLGELEQLRNGESRLRFSSEALTRWGLGTRLLSYSLPLTNRRVESPALEVYLDNLLPEGAIRAQLEQQHGVRPGDTFGLLRHLGAECAGAVQLVADDSPPSGHLVRLDEAEVNRIIAELPTLSAPPGEGVSASLGGVQSKVLLTRTDEGWAWPAAGAMSTHLIKPEPNDPQIPIPDIIAYEHWALQLAATAGVPAARSELVAFGDRKALVVERYDRRAGKRVHQEDFAQALSIRPGSKYEPDTERTSRLRRIATGPGREALDPAQFRQDLLRLVTFNLLLGNGDAHAKNYSLLIDEGLFAMAPVYDIAPVFYLNNRYNNFGMRLNAQRNLQYLTADHLLAEARSWGVPEATATQVLAEVLTSLSDALTQHPDPSGGRIADRIAQHIAALASR